MLGRVVRDKYVQSETIIGRAEEAGELMTRTKQSNEILSLSLTVIWQQNSFFFGHQVGENNAHSPTLLTSSLLSFSQQLHASVAGTQSEMETIK